MDNDRNNHVRHHQGISLVFAASEKEVEREKDLYRPLQNADFWTRSVMSLVR